LPKYGYRCPGFGHVFWQTKADHDEFWRATWKRAKDNFRLLNAEMPDEWRISTTHHQKYMQLYRKDYHARAGEFADVQTMEIARTMGRTADSVQTSLTKMFRRLGGGSPTHGRDRFVREYVNPLAFLMWFMDMFGLKDLRNALPSLTAGFVSAFLGRCPFSDADFQAMSAASSEAALAFHTTGLQPEACQGAEAGDSGGKGQQE
jgi:hypothetical protein